MKKIIGRIAVVLAGVFLLFVAFLGFGSVWGLTTWGEIDIDEIIFQLQAPLGGTESGIMTSYLVKGLLPAVLVSAAYAVIQLRIRDDKKRLLFAAACFFASCAACFFVVRYVWERLDVGAWLEGQGEESDFIERRYADPAKVSIEFPEKKRNLIYIYLESMEMTYADEESGGAFPKNVIPELTALAQDNEDFSGADAALQGGVSHIGSRFTTGGLFAQTAGIPLRIGIGISNMDTQSSFFPSIVTLGDILKKEGYRQVFMCGSEAKFGGRELFFHDHGDFEFRDYVYAKEKGLIPSDYRVWWGFEDEKLFAFAKDTLLELSQGEEPFNLTLLTVDTHFEGGYVCRLCGDEFGDNQYANVMACSSRQTADFVSWIQEQDFYENTTVILNGDHITMSKTFCEGVDPDYQRRTYTAYINPALRPADPDKRREYSTFDAFPTTLAALGARIEGDRLGLGTNLFSDRETLSEEYGSRQLEKELTAQSEFLRNMEKTDPLSPALVERYRSNMKNMLSAESYDEEAGRVTIHLKENFKSVPAFDSFTACYQEAGSDVVQEAVLERVEGTEDEYAAVLDVSGWKGLDGDIRITLNLSSGDKLEELTGMHLSALSFLHDDPAAYLSCLQTSFLAEHPGLAVFIAVKDDATKHMKEEVVQALEALGLEKARAIAGKARLSYLAVIDGGEVRTEEAGARELHEEGLLLDQKTGYALTSAGHDCGNTASILIDGAEHALNRRGLNIVVYDPSRGQALDSARLDTND